ncbi:MAG TPA: cupin domain-containing protein [Thermoanaerobaculia bacterium]|jgi:quercetin dioxygenase-like cupin family protein|nr:cupin domain-containing protein [Thermoanaerobaculia bacterium]
MTTTLDDLAALDALGILSDDEQVELRRLAASADSATLDEASLYREAVAQLAESLDAVMPPPDIKLKVLGAVLPRGADVSSAQPRDSAASAAHERTRRPLPTVLPGRTVRADEGTWTSIAPGVRLKKLSSDRARNTVMVLMEMQPGAVVPPHEHHHPEDSYIIRGSARLGDLVLFAGDFHHVDAGSRHESIISDDGCLAVLVMDAADYLAA